MAEVHGFQDTQAEGFILRRVDADVGRDEVVLDVEHVLAHDDAIFYPQPADLFLERREAGSGHDEELGLRLGREGGHDLQQIRDALDRPEVADVDE